MLQQMETKYQRSLRRFQSLVPHGWRLPNIDWNSAAALEYLGPAAFNKNQQKQIQVVFANAATVYPGSFFNPFTWYIRVRCDDPFKRCDRCNPPENPPPPKRRTKLSDRAKHLALYNIHCAYPIGIANVHTPAERRGGKPTLRSRFTGSYIQLHKDNSAGQDSAESTEQAGRSVDHVTSLSISIRSFQIARQNKLISSRKIIQPDPNLRPGLRL